MIEPPPPLPESPLMPADAVVRFLSSVSTRAESDFYLALFRALPKERFAAISVDAGVARDAVEAVVLDLRYLVALGLVPVVVLGLFETGDTACSVEQAGQLQGRLLRAGVGSVLLFPEAADVAGRITDAARGGVVPVVVFGADRGSDEPAEPSDRRIDRLGALLSSLLTRKMIFLSSRGGLRLRGERVPVVNLTTELEPLLATRELTKKQRLLVARSERLIFDLVPHRLLVAITSPLDLLRELFTVRGAGTLLRRGAAISRHRGLAGVDVVRLGLLIERSFGKAVRPELFARPLADLYLEEGYRGAALVMDTELGAYLTKFAVDQEAQGEGMGRDLWDHVAADHPTIFWRARPENPIGSWYTKLCHGLARFPDWHVYWRGLEPAAIPRAIEIALAQPVDLVPTSPPAPPAGAPTTTSQKENGRSVS